MGYALTSDQLVLLVSSSILRNQPLHSSTLMGDPTSERSPSRKALIARYGCHNSIIFLFIGSDFHDAALEHEEQVVGKNKLIMSLTISVSRGFAGINCMAVCAALRAAFQSLWVFVNRMTFSQVIQASMMCDFQSFVVIKSPILGRVNLI
jgi:hypothetical protein